MDNSHTWFNWVGLCIFYCAITTFGYMQYVTIKERQSKQSQTAPKSDEKTPLKANA